MIAFLRLYALQAGAAVRMSFADRANFTLQVAGMAINNLVFLTLWVLFFAGFKSVGGWGFSDMALLLGLTMTIVGTCGVAFGGYRDMAVSILRGELDALLTQPKGLISRLLARESLATAWGDLAGGITVLSLFAKVSFAELPLVILALSAGLTVYLSAAISFACLAFWASGARSFARDLTDFTLLFSSYPGSIYQGAVKVVAYSILPAGFVVMAPVEMLREPGLKSIAVVVTAAIAYAALAAGLFHLGLRRYRSGASLA